MREITDLPAADLFYIIGAIAESPMSNVQCPKSINLFVWRHDKLKLIGHQTYEEKIVTTSNTNTIRLHRVVKAPPERVYRAFLDELHPRKAA